MLFVRTKAGPTRGRVDWTRSRAGLVSGQSSSPAVLWARPRGQSGATVDVWTRYERSVEQLCYSRYGLLSYIGDRTVEAYEQMSH